MILSKNLSLNSTIKSNNNVMVVGSPGTGKTRNYVMTNLCDENDSSIVLLDPKGELFSQTSRMMEDKGYKVLRLDFNEPSKSTCKYNPLKYLHCSDDITYLSNVFVTSGKSLNTKADPFWDRSSIMMLTSLIAYLHKYCPEKQQTLSSVLKFLRAAGSNVSGSPTEYYSKLDLIFDEISERDPDSFALRQYCHFKLGASRTIQSILISLSSDLLTYTSPEMEELLSKDTVNIPSLGRKKTVLYVVSSDIDRSKDTLINIFFNQLFKELYHEADNRDNHSLKIPVQVYLDDLGTNLKIDRLDSLLASCRSRGIGCSVILQSIGQLKREYGDAFDAITNSCQSFLYLGGLDYSTNDMFSKLINIPVGRLLEMNRDECYVLVQGKLPICDSKYRLEKHPNYFMVDDGHIDTISYATHELSA